MFLIYSTDFKCEENLREVVLGTFNWLISRTHPLIHLQLRSPFLKPQSAEQCLKELSSALETVLGTGGSCWLICGRELLLQAGGDCIHELWTRNTTWVLLLDGTQCLLGPCYHRCVPRHAFEFILAYQVGITRGEKCKSYILTPEPKWVTLSFTWICSETEGRSVCHKNVYQANKYADCRLCKLLCKALRTFWYQSEECNYYIACLYTFPNNAPLSSLACVASVCPVTFLSLLPCFLILSPQLLWEL